MNYRHGYHAGNFADVVKHIALVAIIDHLKKKDAAFSVIDTHAGRGAYDLAGAQSAKTIKVSSAAAGLRIAGLLDKIGRTHYEALRERLVKMVAKSIWQEHPEVKAIRAVFGSINLPSISEFEHGRRESYEFLYAYDFSQGEEPAGPERP